MWWSTENQTSKLLLSVAGNSDPLVFEDLDLTDKPLHTPVASHVLSVLAFVFIVLGWRVHIKLHHLLNRYTHHYQKSNNEMRIAEERPESYTESQHGGHDDQYQGGPIIVFSYTATMAYCLIS